MIEIKGMESSSEFTPSRYYSDPLYYDAVSDYRDFGAECDFIEGIFVQTAGRPLRSVIELACGPAYHGRELARRGLTVTAIDLSQDMVAFARSAPYGDAPSIAIMCGDMRVWRPNASVDLALITQFSFGYLLTNEEITNHLRLVGSYLVDGGLYIIDIRHPRKILIEWDDGPQVGQKHGFDVRVEWGRHAPDRAINPVSQTISLRAHVSVSDVNVDRSVEEYSFVSVERILLPQEFRALIELTDCFRLAGYYGDFDVDQRLDQSPGRRLLAVLQKIS